MDFCLSYNRENKYINEVAELAINYHDSDNLGMFLKKHENQRVIISIIDVREFMKVDKNIFILYKNDPQFPKNWVLRFPERIDEIAETCKESDLPFYFDCWIDRWDELIEVLELGVTDICVKNELGFELDKVAAAARKYGAKVRVIPHYAQTSGRNEPDLRSFYIRPEDVFLYDKIVDVMEIVEEDVHKPWMAETLYKVYAIDQQWKGNLQEIISGLSQEFDGNYVHPLWSYRRVHCEKKCLKGSGCTLCETTAEFGKSLKEAGLLVYHKREEKSL